MSPKVILPFPLVLTQKKMDLNDEKILQSYKNIVFILDTETL